MPYVRIWVHLIWSTRKRDPVLRKEVRGKIFTHIKRNVKEKDIYLDMINGHIDHVHTLISLKRTQTIAKVAQLLKGESSNWIREENLLPGRFSWQDEYIALSVSESMVDRVREYIKNQEEHHRKMTFAEEYEKFLKKNRFK